MRRLPAVILSIFLVTAGIPAAVAGAFAATDVQSPSGPVATQASGMTVSIHELQEPVNASGDSGFAGQNVTTTGTVTAVRAVDDPDLEGFYIQNGTGTFSGVLVVTGQEPSVAPGDVVEVSGTVEESDGQTRIDVSGANASVTVTGSAAVPAATTLATGNVSQEAYEGVLVAVENVTATTTPNQFGEWDVDDGTGSVAVDGETTGDGTTPATTGTNYTRIVGPVAYTFGEFKLQPKNVSEADAGDPGLNKPFDPANATNVTLLTYNDVQTAAAGGGEYNFSRLVEGIHQIRTSSDGPVFVAGAGDQVGPHAMSSFPDIEWRPPIDVLKLVQPDADVIGNHELDYYDPERPFAAVANFSNASEFPWLLANVVENGSNDGMPGTQNVTIVERGNVTVGYIGLADDGAMNGKTGDIVARAGYDVRDPTVVGPRLAQDLKQNRGVDVVVALTHMGVGDSQELAQASTGAIDVIATGDDEAFYPPQVTDGVIVTEAASEAQYLGRLNLTVADGDVVAFDGELVSALNYQQNQTATDIIDGYRNGSLNEVFGFSEVPIESRGAYANEISGGNLGTDGFRFVSGADVAITNAGGIRSGTLYPAGPITGGLILNIYPFPNTVVVYEMSGAQLKRVIRAEAVALETEYGFGAQLQNQFSGIRFEWVPHYRNASAEGDEFSVIRDAYIATENGTYEPLDEDENYTVAVNSFMASAGQRADYGLDENVTFLRDTGVQYGQAALRLIEAEGNITYEDISPEWQGRIRRVDQNVTVRNVAYQGDRAVVTITTLSNSTGDLGEFWIRNQSAGILYAEQVTAGNGTLTLIFNGSQFRSVVTGADTYANLYGEYNDTRWEYPDFEYSIVNADLAAPTGDRRIAGDLNGDGRAEDINGDNQFGIVDVAVLLNTFDSDRVRNRASQFDFNGDGRVSIADVAELLSQL